MRQTAIVFRGQKGTLEGVIGTPDETAGPAPGILLAHPEPQLGGTMESPVVMALVERFATCGFVSMRFNYRGVGGSEGEYGRGAGEVDDATRALRVLRDWPGVDRDRVAVVGYSFGAGVSVRTLMKNKGAVRCAVAVSPSLSMPPLGLEGLQGLATLRRPLLVAIGERDGLTSAVAVGEWVARLSNPNIHLHVVPDTDRSWQGKRVALATLVIDFLSETIG